MPYVLVCSIQPYAMVHHLDDSGYNSANNITEGASWGDLIDLGLRENNDLTKVIKSEYRWKSC
jgi:hypothetical protein